MTAPKVFISYSWTNPDHEAWVLNLASELRAAGVDAILDKWDLKEGHDAIAFMERMVTDRDVKKVIIVCDKTYAEKTNARRGGVGTESQIISSKIYKQKDQDKFVVIVREKDSEGSAYLPAYYETRIFIDFTDIARYSESFDQLLRWIYGEPLHEKPPLGKKPQFSKPRKGKLVIPVSAHIGHVSDELRNNLEGGLIRLRDFLYQFAQQMEAFRISSNGEEFDERVIESIEAFRPFRNDLITLFSSAALYAPSSKLGEILHRFFEALIPLMDRPEGVDRWMTWDFDNLKFIVHEIYLYCFAILLRFERFEEAASLLDNEYYSIKFAETRDNPMVPFTIFRNHLPSLDHRNRRLSLRRLSVHADLLESRCTGVDLKFDQLMQADFTLFLRACLEQERLERRWWPETLLYAGRHHGPFEVYARSKSSSYFDRFKVVLGVSKRDDLVDLMKMFREDPNILPRCEFDSFNPATLSGVAQIASRP